VTSVEAAVNMLCPGLSVQGRASSQSPVGPVGPQVGSPGRVFVPHKFWPKLRLALKLYPVPEATLALAADDGRNYDENTSSLS
jgi:hypothetical protein